MSSTRTRQVPTTSTATVGGAATVLSPLPTQIIDAYDCSLFIDTILPKLYGYPLTSPPICCNLETSTCNDMGKITKIIMSNFSLNGFLAQEIGFLTSLEELYLNDNLLTGPLPVEFQTLSSLKYLQLQNNKLSGPIPPEYSSFVSIRDLFLQNNSFTGTVPESFSQLSSRNLTQFYVQNNFLDGRIPFVSNVPNSTYTFSPQKVKPPVSQTNTFNPVIIPALVSSFLFVIIAGAMVYAIRKYKRDKEGGFGYVRGGGGVRMYMEGWGGYSDSNTQSYLSGDGRSPRKSTATQEAVFDECATDFGTESGSDFEGEHGLEPSHGGQVFRGKETDLVMAEVVKDGGHEQSVGRVDQSTRLESNLLSDAKSASIN